MLTIDFETEAIVGNPIFNPPKPVGVSIKFGADSSSYLRWGHPTGNNTTFEQVYVHLRTILDASHGAGGWLAHNAPFECAVLRKWFNYTAPDPLLVHDTQFELFLTDPYAFSLALKPSAERVLGIAPEEQTTLMHWILANVPHQERLGCLH
jgi:hypothetical protein